MLVTEYERNQLFVWFEEHMGKERAATIMSLLPPVGWADVATKHDLDAAVERLDTKVDIVAERLDTKLDVVAERLDAKIDSVAERLDATIDGVATRMSTKADLQELQSDLQRTFVTWILTAQATVVATIGLLLVALR